MPGPGSIQLSSAGLYLPCRVLLFVLFLFLEFLPNFQSDDQEVSCKAWPPVFPHKLWGLGTRGPCLQNKLTIKFPEAGGLQGVCVCGGGNDRGCMWWACHSRSCEPAWDIVYPCFLLLFLFEMSVVQVVLELTM